MELKDNKVLFDAFTKAPRGHLYIAEPDNESCMEMAVQFMMGFDQDIGITNLGSTENIRRQATARAKERLLFFWRDGTRTLFLSYLSSLFSLSLISLLSVSLI